MIQPSNKQRFLVTHDKCPVCGSTERLGQQAVEKLKAEGALPEAFNYVGLTIQAPLLDPLHPPSILATTFVLKVLAVAIEICAGQDCGAVYCTRFDIVDQIAQAAPHGQAPGGFAGPNRTQRRVN